MVSVYIAHVQNGFYHFRTVIACITFVFLVVITFLESSNMPTAHLIRCKTVIVTGLVKIYDLSAKIRIAYLFHLCSIIT